MKRETTIIQTLSAPFAVMTVFQHRDSVSLFTDQAERYLQQLSKQNDSIAIPVFTGMLIDQSELLSIRITFFRKKVS